VYAYVTTDNAPIHKSTVMVYCDMLCPFLVIRSFRGHAYSLYTKPVL